MPFFDEEGDEWMVHQNHPAWDTISGLITKAQQKGYLPDRPLTILDWGCHSGGLLEHLHEELGSRAKNLDGVEPDYAAREKAALRMNKLRGDGASFFCHALSEVADKRVDVLVSHEVLYLVELDWFCRELKRVLSPCGAAFVALGSHTQNSAWMRWRNVLKAKYGHHSIAHDPWRIVEKGYQAGFTVTYEQMWPAGYPEANRYSPPKDGWGEFESMEEALAFRRAKLLFQFWPR